jgi:hypothetical protein
VTFGFGLRPYTFSFRTCLPLEFTIEALTSNAGRLFMRFTPVEWQHFRLRASPQK